MDEIEKNADTLSQLTEDQKQHDAVAKWKNAASGSIKKIISKTNADEALLEAWLYTRQMEQYFTFGAGKNLFGRNQYIPIGVSRSLNLKITRIAQDILSSSTYERMYVYVNNMVFPPSIHLAYHGGYHQWLTESQTIQESDEFTEQYPFKEELNIARSYHKVNRFNQDFSQEQLIANADAYPEISVENQTNSKQTEHSRESSRERFDEAKQNAASRFEEGSQNPISLPREMLNNIVKAVSYLGGTVITNNDLKKFAYDMAGGLIITNNQGLETKALQDTLLQTENYLENENNTGLLASDEQTQEPESDFYQTKEKNESINNSTSRLDIVSNEFWKYLPEKDFDLFVYLFLGVIALFMLPFLLGYLIGKKRKEANYTVISTKDRRKELKDYLS